MNQKTHPHLLENKTPLIKPESMFYLTVYHTDEFTKIFYFEDITKTNNYYDGDIYSINYELFYQLQMRLH